MNFEIPDLGITLSITCTALIIIILLLEFNNTLRTRLNIIIVLLFAMVVLLAVNAYLQYPLYKNTMDMQDTIQEINNILQPRTYGAR